ncbi:hypothetical protein SAMN04487948_11343 [Halogranum amylolyticum]|uniref:Alkylhydroperoxidase AhpD family core domain-containing protein n=1 Tax=Halogranum amylolyticum TaxID=660520 RepID=A0A1H8UXU5_9EURY|nr:alkylhydroperoxidase [Halogranum amylolyticum]SEP08042.1 hypothetical protein SAMN04487948_11343 [Halogranum amylolyticum]
MPSRIEPLSPTDVEDNELRQLLEETQDGWYQETAFFGAMAYVPDLLERIYSLFAVFPVNEQIDLELLELMRLRIATVHECAYCATVRTVAVEDTIAEKEDAVMRSEIDEQPLTTREVAAVRLADSLAENPQRLSDTEFTALQEPFTEEEFIELLIFASIEVGFDRFCIALRLDTTTESDYPSGLEYPHNPE